MTIKNEPFFGWIDIKLSEADFSFITEGASYDTVEVRRTGGGGSWGNIGFAEIPVAEGFTSLKLRDLYAVSGRTYTYKFKLVDSSTSTAVSWELTASPIECEFDGLWIGNETAQYQAVMNVKITAQREYAVSYVMLYYSRYPHAIQSGTLDYIKGSAEGLFLRTENEEQVADGCTFTIDGATAYKDALAAFLTNGEPKVLKTRDGRIWYVMIDSPVNMASDDFIGDGIVSFNWTQIDSSPYEQTPGAGIVVVA